jgi:UTP--glucose-1-phosphate uridylyltransferase/phosphoglucomutase
VAERTSADKKGGHLARRLSDGRLMLRESAMCPDADKAAFEDVGKHKFFNTNNLWVNLPKLQVRARMRSFLLLLAPLLLQNSFPFGC